jgi:hypothetical protein
MLNSQTYKEKKSSKKIKAIIVPEVHFNSNVFTSRKGALDEATATEVMPAA